MNYHTGACRGSSGYSQESHIMVLRQQDPVTRLWSLCEVHSFLSGGGARVSVRIQWSEYDVSYDVPTV